MIRIVYFTAVTNTMNGFRQAVSAVVSRCSDLSITAIDSVDLRDPEQSESKRTFLEEAARADILIIRLMGDLSSFPCWDDLRDVRAGDLFIVPSGTSAVEAAGVWNTLDGDAADTLAKYAIFGGVENYRNMLLYLYTRYGGKHAGSISRQPPRLLPGQGLYHPDFIPTATEEGSGDNDSKDGYLRLDEYRRQRVDPAKPTTGIWFHRGNWVNGNTAAVDLVIRRCESAGLNVIPVFVDMGSGPEGSTPPAETARTYFCDGEGNCLIDVHLNLMMFSLSHGSAVQSGPKRIHEDDLWFFARHQVPVFQGIMSNEEESVWKESMAGLNPVMITLGMALPELDGNLTTVPVAFKERSLRDPATGARSVVHRGNRERIDHLISLAANWATLRRIPAAEKRVAVIFHNHPPRNDTIGGAYLLDSPATVCDLVAAMRQEGYSIDGFPEDGDELLRIIKNGLTNDSSWLSEEQIRSRAAGVMPLSAFDDHFDALSDTVKDHMRSAFGPPEEEFYIPGREFGNLFVGIQPGRTDLHDPDTPADYQYLAYYWWLRHVWKAHAVVHVGRHGSVEWLYGKGAGLSADCYTDIALGDVPHLYIYVVNAPGEGVQAKRRGSACLVDHNVPVMDHSGLYGEMAELETILDEYDEARRNDPGKASSILERLKERYLRSDLSGEVSTDSGRFASELHDLLDEVKHTQVRDGLHILGRAPEGEDRIKLLAALTTVGSKEESSVTDVLADLLPDADTDTYHELHLELLRTYERLEFEPDRAEEACDAVLRRHIPAGASIEPATAALMTVGRFLVPALGQTDREIFSLLNGLSGRAVPTGPSGAPTRGCTEVLPTGKNFFTLDPRVIPSPTAWETGKRLADSLIERHLAAHDSYPQRVGIVLWAGPSMRTRGDDIAEVLYLLGVRPVWRKSNGWVTDVEVIPYEELGRPRIDVTCKISGLFRDALPNVIALIDSAVNAVAFLNEAPERNFVAANVASELEDLAVPGLSATDRRREATLRVFGVKPGGYGSGVNHLIDSGEWQDPDELGRRYIEWGGWAYAPGMMGAERTDTFRRQLTGMKATVKNQDHRESDFMDSDDWYDYHGGMIAAVRHCTGTAPAAYMGDSSKPDRIVTRSPEEEAKLVFRTRVLNPKWIRAMKRHGYKGALDVSRSLDNAFGWDAVADVVDDRMYRRFAETYLLDDENREWLERVNPDALRNLLDRLFEAYRRGMWDANEEMLEALRRLYLDNERLLEETYDT